jgi:hypothetical protein
VICVFWCVLKLNDINELDMNDQLLCNDQYSCSYSYFHVHTFNLYFGQVC